MMTNKTFPNMPKGSIFSDNGQEIKDESRLQPFPFYQCTSLALFPDDDDDDDDDDDGDDDDDNDDQKPSILEYREYYQQNTGCKFVARFCEKKVFESFCEKKVYESFVIPNG